MVKNRIGDGKNFIFDNSPVGMFIISEDGKSYQCNKSILKYFGDDWSSNEKLTNNFEIIKKHLIENEIFETNLEIESDGILSFYDLKIYSFSDEEFNTYYGGILLNIDKRKDLENQLIARNVELKNTIDNLKETQMRMIQQEKMAGIGQLAAGVAHEINNPLGFVLSNFEVLKDYIEKVKELLGVYNSFSNCFGEDMKKAIEIKNDEIDLDFIREDIDNLFYDTFEGLKRMGKIVKGLRSFSRIDVGEEYENFDFNQGIQDTLIISRNEIKYDAEVHQNLGEIPLIRAVSGQINQVLLNIIVNGGQAIRLKKNENNIKEKGNIYIETYVEGDYVCCSIRDDGCGIKPENINKVILPFFTTKEIGKGTGLGMSISYDIIKNKHFGDIIIESEYGTGTKIIVKLPITK